MSKDLIKEDEQQEKTYDGLTCDEGVDFGEVFLDEDDRETETNDDYDDTDSF